MLPGKAGDPRRGRAAVGFCGELPLMPGLPGFTETGSGSAHCTGCPRGYLIPKTIPETRSGIPGGFQPKIFPRLNRHTAIVIRRAIMPPRIPSVGSNSPNEASAHNTCENPSIDQ